MHSFNNAIFQWHFFFSSLKDAYGNNVRHYKIPIGSSWCD